MISIKKLQLIATHYPDRQAILTDSCRMTWAALVEQATTCVSKLVQHHQGQSFVRACFIADNSIELVVLMTSFATLSVPFVGIDYTLDAAQIAQCIRRLGAECVVCSRDYWDKVAQAVSQVDNVRLTISLDADVGDVSFDRLIETDSTPNANLDALPGRSFESLSFTSGTSGPPKITRRCTSFDAKRFGYLTSRYGFGEADVFLVTLPFYHVSTIGWARMFLGLGATIVLGDIKKPTALATRLLSTDITACLTVPPTLARFVAMAEMRNHKNDSLRFMIVGGKHFPVDLKARALKVFGPVVHEYYGSTETGINVIAGPTDLIERPSSVGRAFEGNRIAILSEAGLPVPANSQGRVAISSYMNMDSYLDHTYESKVLDGDNFILTPDHGYIDADGRLYLLNRAAGGAKNITAMDQYSLEDAIRSAPGVDDVSLMITKTLDGIVQVRCAVALNSRAIHHDVFDMVRMHARAHSISSMEVAFLPEIPYSPSGKVRSRDLDAAFRSNPRCCNHDQRVGGE